MKLQMLKNYSRILTVVQYNKKFVKDMLNK